jgi:aminodeoxyfutalosine deaminase
VIKKFAAHYVFPGSGKPIKNGVITYDETGEILDISQPGFTVQEIAGLEFHAGILVPGFVNTHCHLELSHMKEMIPSGTGLHGFVSKIAQGRVSDEEIILKAAQNADIRMWYNGIAAVGDISNNDLTFSIKKNSKIHYHTFLEIFSTLPGMAEMKYKEALKQGEILNQMGLPFSIVPHSPYSVSPEMFRLINMHALKTGNILCMHNQETPSENELYRSKSGQIYESLKALGVDFEAIPYTGKNSLESIIPFLNQQHPIMLVHNTFSRKSDIEKASRYFRELWLALCPNANLYIEDSLPDISLFYKNGQKICIGTDSLASNHQLSVLEELKTINRHFPEIPLQELIGWATLNGAEALGISDRFGSFEPGKSPGINLISNVDFLNMKLTDNSKVKRLI